MLERPDTPLLRTVENDLDFQKLTEQQPIWWGHVDTTKPVNTPQTTKNESALI
jgi:hypothetical protein